MNGTIPHLRVVVAFCALAALGYLGFSIYVVAYSGDAALRGDVVGTWKSFAVASFAFWVGSSSAGKATAFQTGSLQTAAPDSQAPQTDPLKPQVTLEPPTVTPPVQPTHPE